MTTVTTPTSGNNILWAARDTMTIARRNILAIVRIPTALVFSVLQPIMFVILFRYVFGGAIHTNQGTYVNYLIPGILVQTTFFGSIGTAIGLAEDLQRGLIERFRALPMARMAVLGGRTVADLLRNVLVLVIITVAGFAVGFRPHGGVLPYVGACLVMLVFAYCLSWGFAFVGLAAPNSEAAQAMTFPIVFPITFASSIFVPVASMPSWLQGFATYQPVSEVTRAVRGLMLGLPVGNAVWVTLAWSVGFLILLAPISVNRYRKAA